jgi:hypothetical protein
VSNTVIFSTGAKGGVGKSTMAILMIEALREAGKDVSGIEGDEHSPSLKRKYGDTIKIADVDLAALFGDVGVEAFNEAVNSLGEGYIIVNTPATGSRMFDELPQVLRDATWNIRATWCMSIKADRTRDGVEEDGLFESAEEVMLSGLDTNHITVVRPLFQGRRGQKFWYDNYLDLAKGIGLKEMPMKIFSGRALDAIHRDKRPLPEVIAELSQKDPVFGSSVQMMWYAMKNSMASTVLDGAELRLDARVVPARTKIYGPGGLVEASRERTVTESRKARNVVAEPQAEGEK